MIINKKEFDNAYEKAIRDARRQFTENPIVVEMLSRNADRKLTELFIIYWTVFSAGLTEPIGRYLKQAGKRCRELGMDSIASFFEHHAEEEDGHNNWAEADTQKLVKAWNQRNPQLQLSPEELLENKFSPAVKRYHELHERVISSDTPYGELAIAVEIELITAKFGPRMILQCIKKVGPRILFEMSFLREHVRFDFGHTRSNFEMVDKLLKEHPDYLEPMVEAGRGALETYAGFIGDSMKYAKGKHSLLLSDAA